MKNRFTDEDEGENDDNDEKGKKKKSEKKSGISLPQRINMTE